MNHLRSFEGRAEAAADGQTKFPFGAQRVHIDGPAWGQALDVCCVEWSGNPPGDDELQSAAPAMPVELDTAIPRRKAEYLLGRLCARHALRRCGFDGAHLPWSRGAPAWPPGVVGSITHTEGFVAAAVSRCSTVASVGIDAEIIADCAGVAAIRSIALSERERRVVDETAAHSRYSLAERATAIFSAKESFYKCVYPVIQSSFGFNVLRLLRWLEPQQHIEFELTCALGTNLPSGGRIVVPFSFARGCAQTAYVMSS